MSQFNFLLSKAQRNGFEISFSLYSHIKWCIITFGKLKFVREGLMERLIGQKGWILRKTKIESIWYKETDCIVLWIHLTQKIAKIAFLIQS